MSTALNAAAVTDVVEELSAMLAGDGARLRLLAVHDGAPSVALALDLSDVECLECVLPPERLVEVADAALRRRLGAAVTVRIDDPRVETRSPTAPATPRPRATIHVLDPTASPDAGDPDPGPDAGPLAGKVVGFRVDVLWASWDHTVEEWTRELEGAGATVRSWRRVQGVPGAEGERLQREYDAFVAGVDVVISGLANCGSCTSWSVRDALTGLAAGLATVCVATQHFAALAHTLAADRGRAGLRVFELPYPYDTLAEADVRAHARAGYRALLGTLGASVDAGVGAGAR